MIATLRTLLGYLLWVALFLLSPLSYFYLLQLPFIRVNKYCFNTWYSIDVLVCHTFHNTGKYRTISGWTGQHMNTKKRYFYLSKIIDFIFGPHHCLNEYKNELNLKRN